MLVMVVFFIAFRWIHLSTPLIRLFLLVLILLLMPTLNFLPVWFALEPPSGDLQERVLIRHHDYDQCFQSVQLLQWNSQVKFNVTVYRNLPTTRDSIMTS